MGQYSGSGCSRRPGKLGKFGTWAEILPTFLEFVIFIYALFANNYDFSSKIVFVITLVNSDNKENIIHRSSINCKKIIRSVLVSELYAIVHRFDVGAM